MNKVLALICFLCLGTGFAQSSPPGGKLKSVIERFFDGFHKQDSTIVKSVVSDAVIMQTIGKDNEGQSIVKTENFNTFLKSIVSIPKDKKFEEKLLDYEIKKDGNMANAWVSYEFWFDGKFSHCGVNSFQLFQDKGKWKIIYLIDTRRKESCDN